MSLEFRPKSGKVLTMAASVPSSSSSKQLQIRLLTWQEELAVPTTALSVPASIDRQGLDALVHGLLKEDRGEDAYEDAGLEDRKFDFLLADDFVRGPLSEALSSAASTAAGLTEESVLEVRYVDSRPPPEPQDSSDHDDWVGGVAARGKHVLTACYDGTINIFDAEGGERKLAIPGHEGPAKAVAWVSPPGEEGGNVLTFASGSHDQTVMLYRWDAEKNAVEAMNSCRGHERSVDCLAASPSGSLLASGSFDATLKLWGTKVLERSVEDASSSQEEAGEKSKSKKSKTEDKIPTRTPIMTLAGHKEGVSGVAWMGSESELATCSWDHTIKVWDCGEMRGMKSELVGDRSFFDLSFSPLNGTIITASADSAVRYIRSLNLNRFPLLQCCRSFLS